MRSRHAARRRPEARAGEKSPAQLLPALILLAMAALPGQARAISIADTWTADQPRVQLEEGDFATGGARAEAEAVLEQAWAGTRARAAAALPSGSSAGARVYGDCHGTGLATDSTARAFASANLGMITLLRGQVRTGQYDQGALAQAIRLESEARDRRLTALAQDLSAALAAAAEQLGREAEGRDHDPDDTSLDCTGLARAAAAQVAGIPMARAAEAMGLALAAFRDGTALDYGDALHRQERDLVTADAMDGHDVMDPDWLVPASGAIDGAENHLRARKLILALANPEPAPAVPDAVASTASGMAARAAARQKTALVEVAAGALTHVYALHVPLPVLGDAVAAMEEDGGLGEGLRQERSRDAEGSAGYSQLQFLEATRQYLGGFAREERLRDAGEAEVARMVADVARLRYHLDVLRHRNRLWQTALLATLVGSRAAGRSAEIGRLLASPRQ